MTWKFLNENIVCLETGAFVQLVDTDVKYWGIVMTEGPFKQTFDSKEKAMERFEELKKELIK